MVASLKKLVPAMALSILLLAAMAPGVAQAQSPALADDATLEGSIESYLSGLSASYGVAAVNLNDGRAAFVNADTEFPTASMYKVLVMYRVFEAIDQGSLSMDDTLTIQDRDVIQEDSMGLSPGDTVTVAGALNDMITVSSNTSAFALTRAVGGWGVVASAAGELGMPSTYLDGQDFWSTPNDMAHFFRLLANRSLASSWASQQMIDLLLQQTANDRLPALLPGGVEVAHKTGELEGVRNDGGIVHGAGGRYVIVVMSQSGDPDEEIEAAARISQMVYGYYGE